LLSLGLDAAADSATVAPESIGPYSIVGVLGEGGMGVVYLAEQHQPVRRRVALKVLKVGMDTQAVLARFDAERRALAMMSHPNIARVLEAGETDAGRPYFAMEWVEGEPIIEYCERAGVQLEERLRLLATVCRAVQHAHQKGIMHRDLKPSNILVTEIDGRPIPKVIDFGIAKAIDRAPGTGDPPTRAGEILGTPEYMSPEHFAADRDDIDTRADVYSLGVVAYELLAGASPFDLDRHGRAPISEIALIVRGQDPPRASARASAVTDASASSRSWAHRLKGDLDWIIMKAMSRDRDQRYDTASDLAADIERYLGNEPIVAGPPSRVYRFRKLVRRNRMPISLAVAVFMGILGAALGLAVALERSKAALADLQSARAEAEAANQFLLSTLDATATDGAVLDSLADAAVRRLEWQGPATPQREASLREVVGHVYVAAGEFPAAAQQLERALALRRRHSGDTDAGTLGLVAILAENYRQTGRIEEATTLLRSSLRLIDGNDGFARFDARLRNILGMLQVTVGRYDDAEREYLAALDVATRALGPEDRLTLLIRANRGQLYARQERTKEATSLLEEVRSIQARVLGSDDPDTLVSTNNLAFLYRRTGRYDQARALLTEVLAAARWNPMVDAVVLAAAQANLGSLNVLLGHPEEGEPLLLEAVTTARARLPERDLVRAQVLGRYGACLTALARFPEAEAVLLEARRGLAPVVGADHPQAVELSGWIAELYAAWGRPDGAGNQSARSPERNSGRSKSPPLGNSSSPP
jgi:non-specific serine/threonine protein kinase/serine/threonine-protein kinase